MVDREWLDILLARNAPASAGSWRPGSVFALSQASVRKAARRMLGNAHLANPPAEVERWNGAGRPAFSFGWYAREAAAGRPAGILLQLASLKAFAAEIDRAGAAGEAPVAAELAGLDGRTGVACGQDGGAYATRGLTLVLGADGGGIITSFASAR